MIKINGLRINLSEVEDIISKMNIKSMCLKGETNKILIYIKERNKIEILKKNLPKLLNMHPTSFSIQVIKEFPISMNYKPLYKKFELDK